MVFSALPLFCLSTLHSGLAKMMATQGLSQIQAAYLLNVGTLMILRTNKCPKDFKYVPYLDECYYLSEIDSSFDEATRICKEKGEIKKN